MDADALLAKLLADQHGLILRSQAHALGITDDTIKWRLNRGHWRRVFPGLYATFSGAPTDEQRMIAASLHGGADAQVTGVAALRWHGLRYLPDDERVHILIPNGPRRTSRGFVVAARTNRPDPRPFRRPPLEICSLARAGADAARAGYCRRDVRAFLSEMVQRRLTTVSRLDEEWRAGPRQGSKLLGSVLGELRDGVRSAPEAEFRDLLRTSTILPPIVWNPTLVAADGRRLPRPDGWLEDVGIALETDSDEHHTSPADVRRTRERHNRLAAHGVLTMHFSPRDIRATPQEVLRTIEDAYLRRPRGFTGVRAVDDPARVS
ncbi:type IV toxin-antitoxin system AbiEi family antitoxin domain-containing protein [Cryptosporangium aurantiacum]|uniref:Transcriptional regulator, AbiEi antitoxin, Type IV TA system n=1 Tax=Cryptosporangium aurantiacum TaxID=134849 RepID=A0A1M7L6A2_9ACTN|nr:type IV toxin-antitoxin system AbiEi family antitoxin domain-containing protein [Cryptosporangium aurantiacum]SHM73406.1 Transcriptional regulator, AbiEi antitoxin, Type IV TA system [Cryptosporangium aurantiacum]